jgi:hypothetical protein
MPNNNQNNNARPQGLKNFKGLPDVTKTIGWYAYILVDGRRDMKRLFKESDWEEVKANKSIRALFGPWYGIERTEAADKFQQALNQHDAQQQGGR